MPILPLPYVRDTIFPLTVILISSTLTLLTSWSKPPPTMASIDLSWHAPSASAINNLTSVLSSTGVYDFIYNTSQTPPALYGTYNWCNMPHVRRDIYITPTPDYQLAYVELVHRHHKRTPYASNAFPVESYPWTCTDEGLFYFGRALAPAAPESAETYWKGYASPANPFVPAGFPGDCQFPQITSGGLEDSFVHGEDLYGVYHDLLGFLPGKGEAGWRDEVRWRVTTNQITSQVAGMVVQGMYSPGEAVPLAVQLGGVDSLEPGYGCPAAAAGYAVIKSRQTPAWAEHLDAARELFGVLDDISGVPAGDDGWHSWFDHYYDNLSARQCHGKPLPCKIVDGKNSTTCVTQEMADEVYRFGQWEYSRLYRDEKASLPASVASMGVWFAELANNLRAVKDGKGGQVKWRHNIAHDGSVSRVLSVLQVDNMIWPGMGSEVVFEVYKKKASTTTTAPTITATQKCNRDNCFRQMFAQSESASTFCPTFTVSPTQTVPAWLGNCKGDATAVASACGCVVTPTATATPAKPTSESGFYVRVLFGGKVFKSSNPSLGFMDMLPIETLLGYIDGLVGVDAKLVKVRCNGTITG